MARRMVLSIALLLAIAPSTSAGRELVYGLHDWGDTIRVIEVKRQLFACIDSVERQFSIRFPADWNPIVRIGIDPDLPRSTTMSYGGAYNAESVIVYINLITHPPESRMWFRTPLDNVPVETTMRHELGHAYMDLVSRGYGLGTWPKPGKDDPSDAELDQYYANRILSEGYAETWGQSGPEGFNAIASLPKRTQDVLASDTIMVQYIYRGGGDLIHPLVRQFGYAYVARYIVTHPVKVKGGELGKALAKWRDQAQRDLSLM